MCIKALVCFLDQGLVESPAAHPGLIASYKQDGLPLRIKGKGNPPDAVSRIKAKLLHVGMARSLQRVHARAPQFRAECLKKLCLRKQFVLHIGWQRIEFRVEGRIKLNFPAHFSIMRCTTYDVKSICGSTHVSIEQASCGERECQY